MGSLSRYLKKPEGLIGKIFANFMVKQNSTQYDHIIQKMNIHEHDEILEIGFGHGLGIKKICDQYKVHVTGIDFSETMLTMAGRRNHNHIENRYAKLYCVDFLKYDLPAGHFNKIFCLNVIYFWDSLEVPFAKIFSALKEGGAFVFAMAHRDELMRMKITNDDVFNKYTIEEVVKSLEITGFSDITYAFDREYLVKCIK
jgi:SAM-dependent methyltransferase